MSSAVGALTSSPLGPLQHSSRLAEDCGDRSRSVGLPLATLHGLVADDHDRCDRSASVVVASGAACAAPAGGSVRARRPGGPGAARTDATLPRMSWVAFVASCMASPRFRPMAPTGALHGHRSRRPAASAHHEGARRTNAPTPRQDSPSPHPHTQADPHPDGRTPRDHRRHAKLRPGHLRRPHGRRCGQSRARRTGDPQPRRAGGAGGLAGRGPLQRRRAPPRRLRRVRAGHRCWPGSRRVPSGSPSALP